MPSRFQTFERAIVAAILGLILQGAGRIRCGACRAKKAMDEFKDPRARVRGAAHPFPRTLSMFDFKLVGRQAPEPWTR